MKIFFTWLLIVLCFNLQAQNKIQITLSSERTRIYEPFKIKWDIITNYNSSQLEYRYKLDVPGDWLGGISYAIKKWSDWTEGSSGELIYNDFVIEGNYNFSIEFRLKSDKSQIGKASKSFNVYWEYPEIRLESYDINLDKVKSASSEKESYKILADEFYQKYQIWGKKYDYERKLLKLTTSPDEFLKKILSTITVEATWKLSEIIAGKAPILWLKKILLPKTLYDIIKEGFLELILIQRNIKANTAAFNTVLNYYLYYYCDSQYNKLNDDDKNIVLGFILDSSGSMLQNDPLDMRKSAVEMIINELNGNENVFLIDFDDQATWLNNNNHENYNKEMLKNDIRRVNSDGGTNIGSGLLELQRAIETVGIKSFKGGAILLTDGKNNSTFDFNTLVWYKNNNFPISTVSFVGDVDNKLLNDIATMTNGNYFRANNAYDVVRYFREFINRVSGNSSLTLLRQIIQQGELQSFSFYVDRAMSFIHLGLNWDGSKIRLKLISPSNKIYNENDNNGEWNLGNNYSSVKIFNPESGKWKAEFYGESIPHNGEEYVFQVIGDSPNRITIEEKQLLSGQIQFSLNNDASKNFTDIKAKIEVLTPKNSKEDISKNFSGDGFNYRPRDGEGNYNFEINLIGKDEGGSIIQRYFTRTVLVGEALPSNIAPVKLLEGNYIYTELGKDIGNFPGLECMIYSKKENTPIAKGFVTFVNETECTIEIQEFLSNQEVDIGDIVELDITQWQQDF